MPHSEAHCSRLHRSCCSWTWSSIDSTSLYRRQLSANKRQLEHSSTWAGRSLILRRNMSGPNTVPWGTQECTSSPLDLMPSTSTDWVLPMRKASAHVSRLPRILACSSLPSSRRRGTLWKGLWEVKYDYIKLFTSVPELEYLIGGQKEQGFRWVFGSESMVALTKDLVVVQVHSHMQAENLLQELASYGCERDGTVVCCISSASFLEDGGNPCLSPLGWNFPALDRLLLEEGQGWGYLCC